jgi:flagellar basal-body rod protein FlgC
MAGTEDSMDLFKALRISASGMDAQSLRLRVVAENLANRDTTATTPEGEPYRRKTVTFENRLDRALGVETVRVKQVGRDRSDFGTRYEPGHPAADDKGYVKVPNVNSFIEMMDMREAQRAFSANLAVLEVTRGMLTRAIELLR